MILAPYKSFFLDAIARIENLEIDTICTGHGPVLDEDPWKIIKLSKEYSTDINPNKNKTVVIPYVSAYGYTGELALSMKKAIEDAGLDVKIFDLVYADKSEVLKEIYWANGILFGSPTILGEALKPIWDIMTDIYSVTHRGKLASAFGSYGWSGEAVPDLMERIKQLKMKPFKEGFRIRFKPSENQLSEAYEFGKEFAEAVKATK
jgi:flavorubredoxin